ncbi:MAG: hypothetical protein ACE5IO_05555 [Thermoplasmata archaeon]
MYALLILRIFAQQLPLSRDRFLIPETTTIEPVMIVVDVHEPKRIVQRLEELGVDVQVKKITPGDYIICEIGVEGRPSVISSHPW